MNFTSLKTNKKISKLQAKTDELRQLSLQSILDLFIEAHQKASLPSSVRYQSERNDINDFKAPEVINRSLKISNLQSLIPAIKKFTQKYFSEEGILLSCTLDIIPSQTGQKFKTDHEHLLVYQMQGQSLWQFPLIKEAPLVESNLISKTVDLIESGVLKTKCDDYHLKQHEFLFIPYAHTHKVSRENDSLCAYLTFSQDTIHAGDIQDFIMKNVLKKNPEDFFEELKDDFVMPDLNLNELTQQLDTFYEQRIIAKFRK